MFEVRMAQRLVASERRRMIIQHYTINGYNNNFIIEERAARMTTFAQTTIHSKHAK